MEGKDSKERLLWQPCKQHRNKTKKRSYNTTYLEQRLPKLLLSQLSSKFIHVFSFVFVLVTLNVIHFNESDIK